MLETPFGNINIYIDGVLTEDYQIFKLKNDERYCPDLDGRYFIAVHYEPDGHKHRIECRLEGHVPTEFDGPECGERVSEIGLYSENFVPASWYGVGYGGKISIAVEYDGDWDSDGNFVRLYDYGFSCSNEGYAAFEVLESTQTEEYIFGVAWQNEYDGENAQTWLGADPTMYLFKD